jgi:positive regulator of sigma E activity
MLSSLLSYLLRLFILFRSTIVWKHIGDKFDERYDNRLNATAAVIIALATIAKKMTNRKTKTNSMR